MGLTIFLIVTLVIIFMICSMIPKTESDGQKAEREYQEKINKLKQDHLNSIQRLKDILDAEHIQHDNSDEDIVKKYVKFQYKSLYVDHRFYHQYLSEPYAKLGPTSNISSILDWVDSVATIEWADTQALLSRYGKEGDTLHQVIMRYLEAECTASSRVRYMKRVSGSGNNAYLAYKLSQPNFRT